MQVNLGDLPGSVIKSNGKSYQYGEPLMILKTEKYSCYALNLQQKIIQIPHVIILKHFDLAPIKVFDSDPLNYFNTLKRALKELDL